MNAHAGGRERDPDGASKRRVEHCVQDTETVLDQLDGSWLADRLGADWREAVPLREALESMWFFGYTTGMADSAKVSEILAEELGRRGEPEP